jgi:DNA-binding IclR family transcriptional regulator
MIANKTQSVKSLERGLALLELLASSKAGLSLPDVVQLTGLPKSSVHCLLVTMQRGGYLHRSPRTGRYLFGLRLFCLANRAISGLELRDEATPFLRELVKETGLTVHMAILEEREAVLVAKFEPPGIFRLATWVGKRMDLHCTGIGKALMAYLSQDEVDQIIREHGLPRHNENTICSRRRLEDELVRIAGRGYAVDDEEDELGLRCIGCPIFGPDDIVVASISTAGTTAEVTRSNLRKLAERVKRTARVISQALGYYPAASKGSGIVAVPAVQHSRLVVSANF